MKRKLIVLSGVLIFAVTIAAVGKIYAQNDIQINEKNQMDEEKLISPQNAENENMVEVATGEDIYIVDNTVTYTDDVEGDLFATGNSISIDSTVKGDVFVMGANVNITGMIHGNLFVLGGQVSLNGVVKGKILGFGGNAVINSDVEKDVYFASGTLSLNGIFNDDVRVSTGILDFAGEIKDELQANATQYNKGNEAKIGGKESVTITTKPERKEREMPKSIAELVQISLAWRLVAKALMTIGWVIAAIFVIMFCPVKTKEMFEKLNNGNNWLTGFGIGAMIFIVGPILGLFLLFTVVGTPVALLGIATIIFLAMISTLMAKTWVGYKVLNLLGQKKPNYYVSALVGVILVEIFALAPCIGWIFKAILITAALGIFTQMKWWMYKGSLKKM